MLKAQQLGRYYGENRAFLCDGKLVFKIKCLIISCLVKCQIFGFFRTEINFFQNNAAILN